MAVEKNGQLLEATLIRVENCHGEAIAVMTPERLARMTFAYKMTFIAIETGEPCESADLLCEPMYLDLR